jgi:hypothetical protein
MNNNNPTAADASVPSPGTEQAADQVAKQQQPAPAQPSAMDTVASVLDGVTDAAGIAADILSIFE